MAEDYPRSILQRLYFSALEDHNATTTLDPHANCRWKTYNGRPASSAIVYSKKVIVVSLKITTWSYSSTTVTTNRNYGWVYVLQWVLKTWCYFSNAVHLRRQYAWITKIESKAGWSLSQMLHLQAEWIFHGVVMKSQKKIKIEESASHQATHRRKLSVRNSQRRANKNCAAMNSL